MAIVRHPGRCARWLASDGATSESWSALGDVIPLALPRQLNRQASYYCAPSKARTVTFSIYARPLVPMHCLGKPSIM